MIRLNLISKKRRAYSGRNWTKIITFSLFGLFAVYFLGATLYVIISMSVLNHKILSVDEESVSISSLMLSNNDKLSRFVLTKLILTQMESIDKTRFRYKEYLDQVSALLPDKAVLSRIDFKVKGWISVAVNAQDVFVLEVLEKKLLDQNVWKNSQYFAGSYVESVSKDINGSYTINLQLELKGNG